MVLIVISTYLFVINKFAVADYVGHLSNYDQLKANDLANDNDIQKIAFLII